MPQSDYYVYENWTPRGVLYSLRCLQIEVTFFYYALFNRYQNFRCTYTALKMLDCNVWNAR